MIEPEVSTVQVDLAKARITLTLVSPIPLSEAMALGQRLAAAMDDGYQSSG